MNTRKFWLNHLLQVAKTIYYERLGDTQPDFIYSNVKLQLDLFENLLEGENISEDNKGKVCVGLIAIREIEDYDPVFAKILIKLDHHMTEPWQELIPPPIPELEDDILIDPGPNKRHTIG